jgi:DNA-binding transcriptional regulator YiaG
MTQADLLSLAEVRRKAASGDARSVRLAADLTLKEIGEHCHVSGDAVRGWELGRCVPRGAAALRYARLIEAIEVQLGPSEDGADAAV